MKKKKNFDVIEEEELLKMCIDKKKDYPGKCVEVKKITIQVENLLKKIKKRKQNKQ